jgi:hypothetical protein
VERAKHFDELDDYFIDTTVSFTTDDHRRPFVEESTTRAFTADITTRSSHGDDNPAMYTTFDDATVVLSTSTSHDDAANVLSTSTSHDDAVDVLSTSTSHVTAFSITNHVVAVDVLCLSTSTSRTSHNDSCHFERDQASTHLVTWIDASSPFPVSSCLVARDKDLSLVLITRDKHFAYFVHRHDKDFAFVRRDKTFVQLDKDFSHWLHQELDCLVECDTLPWILRCDKCLINRVVDCFAQHNDRMVYCFAQRNDHSWLLGFTDDHPYATPVALTTHADDDSPVDESDRDNDDYSFVENNPSSDAVTLLLRNDTKHVLTMCNIDACPSDLSADKYHLNDCAKDHTHVSRDKDFSRWIHQLNCLVESAKHACLLPLLGFAILTRSDGDNALLEAPDSSNDTTQTADVCDVYLFFNDLMTLWNPPWHFIISCCIHHVRLSRCDARQVQNPLFGLHCVLSSIYTCVNPALYWTEDAMKLSRNEEVDRKLDYCQLIRTSQKGGTQHLQDISRMRQKGGTKHLQVISRVILNDATKIIYAVKSTTNGFIAFQSWLSRCLAFCSCGTNWTPYQRCTIFHSSKLSLCTNDFIARCRNFLLDQCSSATTGAISTSSDAHAAPHSLSSVEAKILALMHTDFLPCALPCMVLDVFQSLADSSAITAFSSYLVAGALC